MLDAVCALSDATGIFFLDLRRFSQGIRVRTAALPSSEENFRTGDAFVLKTPRLLGRIRMSKYGQGHIKAAGLKADVGAIGQECPARRTELTGQIASEPVASTVFVGRELSGNAALHPRQRMNLHDFY